MSVLAAPSEATSPLDHLPWTRILRDIQNRQVLPIVGPGLVTVDTPDGPIPFIDWLAPQVAERLGLPTDGMETLNQVAGAYLANRRPRKEIYAVIRDLVAEHRDLPIPSGLMDLAAIRDFRLFLTSTFDPFLCRALVKARPGYRADESGRAAFHPSRPVDLPERLNSPFVFHVLGAYDTYPDFAVWEEDFMEFLCGLLETPKDNRLRLFSELKQRSLLLIGAPFGDWIVRFFLRVAKQVRLSECCQSADDYLAEQPLHLGAPTIFYFDKVLGSPHIIPCEPHDFAAELRKRWQETCGGTTNGHDAVEMQKGAIFISYSHDDLPVAERLAGSLRDIGMQVYLDRRNLQAGADYEKALMRAVKLDSSIFLSLISHATESDADRFVHRERKWAAERHVPGYIFYIPVVIDDTRQVTHEPVDFEKVHRHHLPDGELTPEFARLLGKYLERYHRYGEVRDE